MILCDRRAGQLAFKLVISMKKGEKRIGSGGWKIVLEKVEINHDHAA
jgi:hypothetical protein